jgi:flagellar biosynthesis/type III secretory pathway chaperone
MEATVCRQQVAKLIAEAEAALAELIRFLEREHEHLAANDVTALEGAVQERQRSVARVVRADDTRIALCRQLGRGGDARGLEQILGWCDPDRTLAADWARCKGVAANCRALNDRNGALVHARLKHVHARLAALFKGRGETVAYGPRGAYALGGVGQVVKVDV